MGLPRVYSWIEMLTHLPEDPYRPSNSTVDHCNFCKKPLTVKWHGEPLFNKTDWHDRQARFFEVEASMETMQIQMAQFGTGVDPSLLQMKRQTKVLSYICARLFTPEEIMKIEVEALLEVQDTMQNTLRKVQDQAQAPKLHLAQKPAKLIIPGNN